MDKIYKTMEAEPQANRASFWIKENIVLLISSLALGLNLLVKLKQYPAAGALLVWLIPALAFLLPWMILRGGLFLLLLANYPFTDGWLVRWRPLSKYLMSLIVVGLLVCSLGYTIFFAGPG